MAIMRHARPVPLTPMLASLIPLTPENVSLVFPLMQAYYAFEHLEFNVEKAQAAWQTLFAGEHLGQGWLIYVDRRPVGYVVLAFGFSLEFGGRDATLDELYLDETVRGQGIGRQVLERVFAAARSLNICALHLEVDRDNSPAQAFYERMGFEKRGRYFLMSQPLSPEF